MPTTITELAQYTGPIEHPNPGESASAAQLLTDVSQHFANRTRYLVLDAIGARLTTLAPFTIKPSTTDDFSVIVGGPPTSLMAHVAGGYGGLLWTSHDGEIWTARTVGGGYSGTFTGGTVAGSGRVVLVGDQGGIQTSDDGVTWTARTPAAGYSGSLLLKSVAYGGGVLVAVGGGSAGTVAEIQTSADNGVTWVRRTSPTSLGFQNLVYTGSRFVALQWGSPAGNVLSSVDGVTWTLMGTITSNFGAGASLSTNGNRLVVGTINEIHYSDDFGVSWTTVSVPSSDNVAIVHASMTFARGVFVCFAYRYAAGSRSEIFVSDNGAEWFSCGAGPTLTEFWISHVGGRWYLPDSNGVVQRTVRSLRI